MVAVLDDWQTPIYVTRVWTVFEQFCAQELEIVPYMILPPAKMETFTKALQQGDEGLAQVQQSLTRINVENAQASVKADEEKVKGLIKSSVGFARVNAAVQGRFTDWCKDQFGSLLERNNA
jgi:hypothetical protein